ncbi:transglutaminase-like domain-containing protein [Nitrincola nitratireducens]|uniref:Transglutaminase-like superfamily protein n=1 Tax=Nitrincola nitratireducens TaxID=1229521 RepID=W9URR4_9GAMM|nr:transglutaminase family protein [Nitrincola nitratireducens]EXJ09913.1 Transglutaminase-like superfamily protein [Nitrincola nitratireducens]
MYQYLESTEYIDWKTPAVLAKAKSLADGANCVEMIAEKCFLFVRDKIEHSWDFERDPVTCKASDVLEHGTGYCYAKSHLLAGLLRANGIPAGLCYQRLTISNDKPPFCLHGLNAVYLEDHGWYRIDARGNKEGVSADFCPPVEKLAFPIISDGEANLPEIWASPIGPVLEVLLKSSTYKEVADNLPDIQLALANKAMHAPSA